MAVIYKEVDSADLPAGTVLPQWTGGGSGNNPPGTFSQGDGTRMNTWNGFTAADYATWRGLSLTAAQAAIDAARAVGLVV